MDFLLLCYIIIFMETFNAEPVDGGSNSTTKVVVSLITILLVLGGIYYLWSKSPASAPTSDVDFTKENVSVSKVDLSSSPASKLPAGFPSAIPVEQASITDSYKAENKK